jgi:competence protein ComEC
MDGLLLVSFGMLWLCLWRGDWRWWGVPLMALGLAAGNWHTPPDLLVSADARLVAVRHADAVWWQRQSGASGLTRDSWLRQWGIERAEALPRSGEVADGAITCSPGACVLVDQPRVVLLRGDAPAEACRDAALVLSAEPLRGHCATRVIDRFTVWREGAQAVWLRPDGVVVVSDRALRGDRPWVPPPPRPRAAPEAMAAAE